MPEITIKSMLAAYRRDKMAEEMKGEWGAALLYRPLALALIVPLARAGVSPIAVTLFGVALLPLIVCFAFFVPAEAAMLVVCLLSVLYHILDCADGSLARALRRESLSGWYIDLTSDLLYRPTVYASLGHVTDVLTGSQGAPWLAIGLLSAWLALFARIARLYSELLIARGTLSTPAKREAGSRLTKLHMVLSGLDSLLPLLVLVAWWLGWLKWFWLWILAYSAADALYSHCATWSCLQRHPVSRAAGDKHGV